MKGYKSYKLTRPKESKLFEEIINSVPVEPKKSSICLITGGIFPFVDPGELLFSWNGSDKKRQLYVSNCSKKGILPFTSITVRYNTVSTNDISLDQGNPNFDIDSQYLGSPMLNINANKSYGKLSLDSFFSGGKIHQINIIFEDFSKSRPNYAKNFKNFKNNLLNRLLENNYELFKGSFQLGYKSDLNSDSEDYAKLTFKTYKSTKKKNSLMDKVELHLKKTSLDGTRSYYKPFFYDDLNILADWFNKIEKKKYN